MKLCEVRADGKTLNICDGVVRASYQCARNGQGFAPGEVVEWQLDLLATAIVIPAGHRLRVLVSSSDFPRYDRNPNTGERAAEASSTVSALQRVYHDEHHPSQIILPLV